MTDEQVIVELAGGRGRLLLLSGVRSLLRRHEQRRARVSNGVLQGSADVATRAPSLA